MWKNARMVDILTSKRSCTRVLSVFSKTQFGSDSQTPATHTPARATNECRCLNLTVWACHQGLKINHVTHRVPDPCRFTCWLLRQNQQCIWSLRYMLCMFDITDTNWLQEPADHRFANSCDNGRKRGPPTPVCCTITNLSWHKSEPLRLFEHSTPYSVYALRWWFCKHLDLNF